MTRILISPGIVGETRRVDGPCVALLHGLGRSTGSLWLLGRRLMAAGFAVWRVGYPSLRLSVAEAVARVTEALAPLAGRCATFHLVGHSLGGIIAARIAEAGRIAIGRVVQIGAPNRGAVAGARLLRTLPMGWCLGPAGTELSAELPPRPRRADTGAIAGISRLGLPGCLFGVRGPGDGTVSLRSAWDGAEARAAVFCGHTLLPLSGPAAALTAGFLAEGRFPHIPGSIAR
jgi:pimeloyl-ACP methyl ester carboxylesterase